MNKNRFKVDTTKLTTVADTKLPQYQPEVELSELEKLKREVYWLREEVARLRDTASRYREDELCRNQRYGMGG